MTMHPGDRAPRKTIAVDFDGVLHLYTKKIGLDEQHMVLDPPVDGAVEWCWEMIKHYDLVVFTCRHVSEGGLEATVEWLKQWGFPWEQMPVTGTKPVAQIYIDDRGYHFTGIFPTVEEIKSFKPWNRECNWDRE